MDDLEIYFNCNALMYKPRVGDWFSSNIDDANWPSIYSFVGFPFFWKKISILEMEFRDISGINGHRKFSGLRHVNRKNLQNGNRKISNFHFVNRKNFRLPFRKPEIVTVYVT